LACGCRGLFIIGLGGLFILRTAAPDFREGACPDHRLGVALRGRFLEQGTGGDIVFLPAGPLRVHQPQLKLGFRRIGIRRLGQRDAGLGRIGWRTAIQCRKIGDAARISCFGCALKQLARFRRILLKTGSGAIHDTKLDPHRRATLFSRLPVGADRFQIMSICEIGAAQLVLCPKRFPGRDLAEPDRGRDV
jgi:hypothetical protein